MLATIDSLTHRTENDLQQAPDHAPLNTQDRDVALVDLRRDLCRVWNFHLPQRSSAARGLTSTVRFGAAVVGLAISAFYFRNAWKAYRDGRNAEGVTGSADELPPPERGNREIKPALSASSSYSRACCLGFMAYHLAGERIAPSGGSFDNALYLLVLIRRDQHIITALLQDIEPEIVVTQA